eukprot:11204557-Lingulodinium_polyedra.AAC.1
MENGNSMLDNFISDDYEYRFLDISRYLQPIWYYNYGAWDSMGYDIISIAGARTAAQSGSNVKVVAIVFARCARIA